MTNFTVSKNPTEYSHIKPGETTFTQGGLRDFFLYRDLGVSKAKNGKANMAAEMGTGWHRHGADFQIVIMTKGRARFMYEDQETMVEGGDVVHQRPGIRHFLFDYPPDMEYLEIVGPADFKSIAVDPVCDIPAPTPWAVAA